MTHEQLEAKVGALQNVVNRTIALVIHLQNVTGHADCASCSEPRERLRETVNELDALTGE